MSASARPTVCVVGLGYIGLPTASFLGTKGYKVHGVDVDPKIVETIKSGRVHIAEPDLDILVKSAVQSGNLTAGTKPVPADIFVIAVPTPFKGDHEPDLTFVERATESIIPHLKKDNLIILESTSPVGTTRGTIARKLTAAGFDVGKDVFVAYCPERVLPGRILTEFVENDRVVGGINDASTEKAAAFYSDFVRGEVLKTDSSTAEMIKLVENSYRDVNIAFANEISIICDKLNVNPWEVISLANRHPRVDILKPGPGVGGHCIAVDPWFIVSRAPEEAQLIRAARKVNDGKPEWVIDRVKRKAAKFKEPIIGCLGLAFKADVDDLRESPALHIVRRLRDEGIGRILVAEPNVKTSEEFDLMSVNDVVMRSDILVVLVDHREFKQLKAAALKEKVVIDTRGIL